MHSAAKQLAQRAARSLGYDKTHITRVIAYRAVEAFLDRIGGESLDALEISAGSKWQQRPWRSFTEMNWPDYDICAEALDRQFDVVIADNVWEHLPYPYRAAKNVHAMLRPGGWFVNIEPFLIRRHAIALDCTRWTETGMFHWLEEAGCDSGRVETRSWGNRAAVKANFSRWARAGCQRRFPMAFARKSGQ